MKSLRDRARIDRIFREGSFQSLGLLHVRMLPNALGEHRCLVGTSKRVGPAVRRNLLKRRIREAIACHEKRRLQKISAPGAVSGGGPLASPFPRRSFSEGPARERATKDSSPQGSPAPLGQAVQGYDFCLFPGRKIHSRAKIPAFSLICQSLAPLWEAGAEKPPPATLPSQGAEQASPGQDLPQPHPGSNPARGSTG